jgi:hypothetical protein
MTSDIVIAYIWDCIVVPAFGAMISLHLFGPFMMVLSVLLLICTGHLYFFLRGILWK